MPAPKQPYTGQPVAIAGKMFFSDSPTPDDNDRIYLVRRDTRAPGYKEPNKGDPYVGPNAEKFEGYFFITWNKTDQIGWVDEIYLNERANEDAYNGEITYPYVDKDYPMITRSYVVLRGDQRADEPDADAVDSVYSDLRLTDHKIYRIQSGEYAFLDKMFVGIQRVYERLPGPVIRTYEQNQFQQVVNVDTQTVQTESVPTPDATTEVDKTARTGTAKAQVVLGTVDSVFPHTKYTTDRSEHIIPFKFRAKVPSELVQQTVAGTASQPVLAQDEWTGDETQDTLYKKTISRTIHNLGTGVGTLEYKLTNDQQLSTIVDTWQPNAQTIVPTSLLTEADVIELGNGDTIKSETTIPEVFGATVYQTEISDPIPERFKVVAPLYEIAITSTGNAAQPTLGTGDVSVKDEQRTVFWHRVTTRTRGANVNASLVSYKMTSEQQVETVTETLGTGLQTISPLTALTVEADTENLGNNTSLLRVGTVPDVFPRTRYETSIPDLVPLEFRGLLPVTTTEYTIAGTAQQPGLGTGQFSASDEQITVFKHRQSSTGRSVGLTATLLDKETTEEYGGGILLVYKQIGTAAALPIQSGLLYVSSTIKNLGNGLVVRETKVNADASWPILTSYLWSDEMQTFQTQTTQVVAAGTAASTGTNYQESIKAIDVWRSQRIRITSVPIATGVGNALITYEWSPFQFPGLFDYIFWLNYAHGTGFRKSTAQLVKHKIRTWWQNSSTPPAVSDIITDTVTLPIYTASSTVEFQRYENVLHDAFSTTQGEPYQATTPTLTQYKYGTPTGGSTHYYVALVVTQGSGYVGGASCFVGGHPFTVVGVGAGGSLWALDGGTPPAGYPTGVSLVGSGFAVSGGGGTGATADLYDYSFAIYSGAWIGSEKVVAAKVEFTNVPNLWKVQTSSVIMR